MGVRRCCSSRSGQNRGAVLLCSTRRDSIVVFQAARTGGFWAGALAQEAWPPRVVSGYVRPGEGRALQARRVVKAERCGVWRFRQRDRTGQDPGDAKSVAAYVPIAPASASLGHQIHRAVSPRCGACWRGLWAGATSTKMARRTRDKDKREEIESRRAGRERPSAVDVGRGGPILCCTCTGAASTGRERALWLAGVGAPAAKATCATVAGR